ncbi:hypothetical protein BC938DRAFT_482225 [Jimgerdemannia flammicorona]|uniref:Uncharacterized protein n=1 Tax=Jimgerdemannia flammicorona TaxID=994334 RepID=A0A433QWP0_9FUNG|nr:hypothetical protein BC938DRAFT_482225 [Jimgerdemannia flammicorona]
MHPNLKALRFASFAEEAEGSATTNYHWNRDIIQGLKLVGQDVEKVIRRLVSLCTPSVNSFATYRLWQTALEYLLHP